MYIGRFAPSPTGPLHFGSLIAAVASYCDAKANHGKWLIRMEDLDQPRTIPGVADNILSTLQAFGFVWNDEIIYQSQRTAIYATALQTLKQQNIIYPCACSRKEIADSAITSGIEGLIYPKTCLLHPTKASYTKIAYRIIVPDNTLSFTDQIQGEITQNLAREIGDFIIKRADEIFAYQFAVVVDDAEQGITHVIRGADLLNSTPRQIYLQYLLQHATPHYAHFPIVVNAVGEKLSKQTLAKAIHPKEANKLIFDALNFLGQSPPTVIKNATLDEVWHWAISNWKIDRVPKNRISPLPVSTLASQ